MTAPITRADIPPLEDGAITLAVEVRGHPIRLEYGYDTEWMDYSLRVMDAATDEFLGDMPMDADILAEPDAIAEALGDAAEDGLLPDLARVLGMEVEE